MDADDLPPRRTPPREETAAGAFGRLIGTLIWLALFATIAGAGLYLALRWKG
jgi:hypothetical protein